MTFDINSLARTAVAGIVGLTITVPLAGEIVASGQASRAVPEPTKAEQVLDGIVNEERLRDRGGISHAGRLDDDPIELERTRLHPLGELGENGDQVLAHCAADASIHHLDDLLICLHLGVLLEQRVINADFAKFW